MFRAAIAFLLLLALPAGAESPQERFRRWWIGPDAKELGLTNEQSDRIDKIFQSSAPRIHLAAEDAANSRRELDRVIAGDKTTETDVVRQLNLAQAARNELDRQYTLMLFRFYQELTPEQRQKVKAMSDREQRRGGRRGQPPIKK